MTTSLTNIVNNISAINITKTGKKDQPVVQGRFSAQPEVVLAGVLGSDQDSILRLRPLLPVDDVAAAGPVRRTGAVPEEPAVPVLRPGEEHLGVDEERDSTP